MPARRRFDCSGVVCHVMNRSAKRLPLFDAATDYSQFLAVLTEAQVRRPVPILSFCIMPNHWHLVLWPSRQRDLEGFAHWLTLTHAMRWRRQRGTEGGGAVYQGRYKVVPVQSDRHFYSLVRYVERNPVRAGLVARADAWRWSSGATPPREHGVELAPWPVERPAGWLDYLNRLEPPVTLRSLRHRVGRCLPVGDPLWSRRFVNADVEAIPTDADGPDPDNRG